jgi:hypothetical protein
MSISVPPGSAAAISGVSCDLCEAPMQLPPGAVRNGQIIGLIVCTQCTEDALDARAFEPRAEVGLVGTGGCR